MILDEQMNIVIVGHVDHGKSTIVGRLLADTGSLPEGKLEGIRDLCERTSKPFEYAFLLDALKDEQSQGITIDAARVFFKSKKRHYIIIDAPGHIEFLKNMITGASRAESALIVIDASEGVRENSRRHGYMLSMLGIRNVAVVVNKMDLAGYSREAFEGIKAEFAEFLGGFGVVPTAFIPVSGREGDNIAASTSNMSWYSGPTVLEALDAFSGELPDDTKPFRMPVQDVYKFTRFGDSRRIVAGAIATGKIAVGDRVVFYPSGKVSTVATIESFPPGEAKTSEIATNPVGFTLAEQIYVTRGELAAVEGEDAPQVSTRLKVSLFWLGARPFAKDKTYTLRIGTKKVAARLEEIISLINSSTLAENPNPADVPKNGVAECVLACEQSIAFDISANISATGRFVLIEDFEIRGGGIILAALPDAQAKVREKVMTRNIKWEKGTVTGLDRARRYGQGASLVLFTGVKGSRNKQLAKSFEDAMFKEGRFTYYLGMGNVLYGVDADIKHASVSSLLDNREEHLRRFAEVANLIIDSGLILVASALEINPYDLDIIKTVLAPRELVVVWVGDEISTGIAAHLRIKDAESAQKALERVKSHLAERKLLQPPAE